MSRNVERMKRNGWLAIRPGKSARAQELRITDPGRKIVVDAEPLWREAQSRAREIPGAGGAEAVYRLADAIQERSVG